jgi:hypothetical protein
MADENELSDKAKQVLANTEIVDMAEEGRQRAKQKELEFAKKLDEPAERKTGRRETSNLVIALFALLASFYSVFITHRDAEENLHQSQRAYIGIELKLNFGPKPIYEFGYKVIGSTPAKHVTIYGDAVTVKNLEAVTAEIDTMGRDASFRTIDNVLLLPGTIGQLHKSPIEVSRTLSPVAPDSMPVIIGRITYTDVFDKPHHTDFCIQNGTFCRVGNDAN